MDLVRHQSVVVLGDEKAEGSRGEKVKASVGLAPAVLVDSVDEG